MRLSRVTRRALLALSLIALAALPALAQKSTISSRSGRSGGGGFSGASSGRMSPVATPRGGAGSPRVAVGSSAPSIGRPTVSAPTLSPGFPMAGRQGTGRLGAGPASSGRVGAAPAILGGGTLSPGFPARGRESTSLALAPAGRSSFISSRSALATASDGKRFLPVGTLPVRGSDGVHDWHKRSVHHHGTSVILFDPFFFGDPFFFHGGFFVGDPFFYHDPFFFGHRFVFGDPFFFGHTFGFGRPLYFGPGYWNLYWGWPGFWTGAAYGSGLDYANGYSEGFERGYSSGQAGGDPSDGYAQGDYGLDLQGAAPPDAGYVPPAVDYWMPSAAFPTSASFERGLRCMADGPYAAAASAFEAYVRESTSDGRGKLARGTALLALGRISDAAVAFRRGVDDYAPDEVIVFDMPALFGSRSAFRGAQGALEDAVRRRADDLDGRFDLGVLYLFSGEREAAQTLLGGVGGDPYADRLLRQALGG
jgi:hypothetical protein